MDDLEVGDGLMLIVFASGATKACQLLGGRETSVCAKETMDVKTKNKTIKCFFILEKYSENAAKIIIKCDF